MSNDNSQEQPRSILPVFTERPDSPGHDAGSLWVLYGATDTEKSNLFDVFRGEQSDPDFLECDGVDDAIQELVRVTLPSEAENLDSAREYWRAITRYEPHPISTFTLQYVDGFFEGALECVQSLVRLNAHVAASDWVALSASPEDLEETDQIVAECVDPEGAEAANENFWSSQAALLVTGRDPYIYETHAATLEGFRVAFALTYFSSETEEFAEFFFDALVAQIRRRRIEPASRTDEQAGQSPRQRESRHIRIRERNEAEQGSDADEPPQGPSQPPPPPSTP